MKCHEILRVSERCTREDILSAYDTRVDEVCSCESIDQRVREAKLRELDTAKEDCIRWIDMPFTSRLDSRVAEFASQIVAPTRLNSACCIGPCSCIACCIDEGMGCEGLCGTIDIMGTSFYRASICDIIICAVFAIAIGIRDLIEKEEDKKRKREAERQEEERRKQAESERLARLANSEKACRDSLRRMLQSPTPQSVTEALHFIDSTPNKSETGDRADRYYAINATKPYIKNVDDACKSAIHERQFEQALLYLRLLMLIDSKGKNYEQLRDRLNRIMKFMRADKPYIMTDTYSIANGTMLNELSRKSIHANLLSETVDFQSLVWELTLKRPFDPHLYSLVYNQLSKNDETIDILSSLIYIDVSYGRKTVNMISSDYWEKLTRYVARCSQKSLLSLASVSAWCKNDAAEHLCLNELKKRDALPEYLRNRFQK